MKYIPIIIKSLIFVFTIFFLFGCYATTHRGPATLKPGQFSGNIGYLYLKGADAASDDEPGKLMTVDVRAGLLPFMDIGLIRTFDFSDYGDAEFDGMDTYWVDTKLQLSNIKNKHFLPQLALGYGFGDFIADDDEKNKLFINSLYITLGIPTEFVTPYYSFRYEHASDEIKWLPSWTWEEDFNTLQKAHIIGFEVNAIKYVKPVIEVGRFYIDDFSDGANVFTAGLNFYLDVLKLRSSNISTTE
ncbi:MAG: hypothetical protein GWP19_15810 [Planctomycetia bacterium]|nr:hypothetical protein [Planctomycetia bacterium]